MIIYIYELNCDKKVLNIFFDFVFILYILLNVLLFSFLIIFYLWFGFIFFVMFLYVDFFFVDFFFFSWKNFWKLFKNDILLIFVFLFYKFDIDYFENYIV